jgi:hypothetical protein
VNRYALWFRWAVVAGILQDWLLGVPGIVKPNAVLRLVKVKPVEQPIWPAFASLLLTLLSIMYIPGAVNPLRYRAVAILSVLARAAGVTFFFGLQRGKVPPWFGAIDLFFLLVQGPLLFLTYREDRNTSALTERTREALSGA